ncbi:MAG TPA: DUF6364 family protein [Egibacteraceae bacterium]|nr:DUF6364 family protein [Egibacteraceae bacterium]
MTKRNLTVQLDEVVIRLAKVLAAKQGKSVSTLVARELERLVEDEKRYQQAWQRARYALGRASSHGGRRWRRDARRVRSSTRTRRGRWCRSTPR